MCEPISGTMGIIMAVTSAVLTAASTATSIALANKQSKAQQAQLNYQAKVAEQNKKIAEENASTVRQQGVEETRLQRFKTLQNVASQQAAMAANGIDITQGTPLDVIEDTATTGELDALQTKANWERKAQAYDIEAGNFANQANMDKIAAQNVANEGRWNALSLGLAGTAQTASVADKWFDFSGKKKNDDGVLNQAKYSSIFNTSNDGIWANAINSYVMG